MFVMWLSSFAPDWCFVVVHLLLVYLYYHHSRDSKHLHWHLSSFGVVVCLRLIAVVVVAVARP